jgi:hypothetical protein
MQDLFWMGCPRVLLPNLNWNDDASIQGQQWQLMSQGMTWLHCLAPKPRGTATRAGTSPHNVLAAKGCNKPQILLSLRSAPKIHRLRNSVLAVVERW